jgi:hypothetical protein
MKHQVVYETPETNTLVIKVPYFGSDGFPVGFLHQHYHPLTSDAQAMALVKHLRLHITDMQDGNTRAWSVFPPVLSGKRLGTYGRDLNRAIVECVAKLADTGAGER